MKKILCICLAAALCLSLLGGCGSNVSTATDGTVNGPTTGMPLESLIPTDMTGPEDMTRPTEPERATAPTRDRIRPGVRR